MQTREHFDLVAMARSRRSPPTGFPMRFAGGLGSRALRGPNTRRRPTIQIGRVIDRIPAGLAEHRPAADHRQLCKPLPRAREAITIGDVGSCVGAAQVTVAARVRGIVLLIVHLVVTPGHSGTLREVTLNGRGPRKTRTKLPRNFNFVGSLSSLMLAAYAVFYGTCSRTPFVGMGCPKPIMERPCLRSDAGQCIAVFASRAVLVFDQVH